jgi:hypothetical protein
MEILASLNPPQRAAVEQTEGALLVSPARVRAKRA